jgi:hypothetical protein
MSYLRNANLSIVSGLQAKTAGFLESFRLVVIMNKRYSTPVHAKRTVLRAW